MNSPLQAKRPSVPSEIVARLEVASEGSRELDVLIAVAFDLTSEDGDLSARRSFALYGLEQFAERSSRHNNAWNYFLPSYTASLDAALALAERTIARRGPIDMSICGSAQVVIHHHDPCASPLASAFGKTPALALCIAILKATTALPADSVGIRAADEQKTETGE